MGNDNKLKEIVADIAALATVLVFLGAFVIGLIHPNYKMPEALNLVVGLAATYLFGQRVLQGPRKNENSKDGPSGDSSRGGSDFGRPSDDGAELPRGPDTSSARNGVESNSDVSGGVQRGSDPANDSKDHEGAD